MAETTAATLESEESPGTWQIQRDRRARIHTLPGSWAASQAATELRRTEKVIDELESLLQPEREQRGGPVEIYLIDRLTAGGLDAPLTTANPNQIVRVVQPDAPAEPIAWPVTRLLVT